MNKILILTNNDIGLYKFRKELIEELLKNNDVFISLPDGGYIEELVNIGCKFINTKIDRRGINPLNDFKLIREYNAIIKNINPNLVLTYTIKPNIYGGLICRIRGITYATNITGLGSTFQKKGILQKIIINMYKYSLKKSKAVFFENEDNKKKFIDNKITSVSQSFKLSGAGVNLHEYSCTLYPTEDDTIRFLFIGRIMKEKGIDELLEVAQKIKLKFRNIKFDIIGPEEDIYSDTMNDLESKEIISYYGYKEDIKPYISQSHCFILPSYHEGMANTLLESGAMGRPLIASDIPGCREAIIDGQNGYLIKPKDSEDLYLKILKFINLTHEDKKKMAIYSRKHIQENFDKSNVVKQTIDVLKQRCNIDWRDDNEEDTNFTFK